MKWMSRFFGVSTPTQTVADEKVRVLIGWRIAEALRVGGVEGSVEPATAWQRIASLDGEQLLAFDQGVRFGSWSIDDVADSELLLFAASDSIPERATAYRFTATCSRDGFVREQALRELGGDSGRLALAAGLIRSRDWVRQVRLEAGSLILGMMRGVMSEPVFGLLDLYVSLQRRNRGDWSSWQPALESVLRSTISRDERWKATRHHDQELRRLAYELVLEADPDRVEEALSQAIDDRSCAIALWALSQFQSMSNGPLLSAAMDRAERHPHPAMRAEALRMRHAQRPDPERLRAAMLDRARSVRNAAAYALRNDFQASPQDYWRKVIASGSPRGRTIARIALVEHAEPGDAAWLGECLSDPNPRSRAAALNSLARIDAKDLQEKLDSALVDDSPRVIRQALRIHVRSAVPLDPARVAAAFEAASGRKSKVALLGSAVPLGKWDGLNFLLDCCRDQDVDLFRSIEPHLRRWHLFANQNFTPLSEVRREVLRAKLSEARDRHRGFAWARVESML